jgi:hypothetical protein
VSVLASVLGLLGRALFAASIGLGSLAVAVTGASAQSLPASAPPDPVQAISVNPLFLPFGGYVAEFERAVGPTVTLGLSGAYYDPVGDDDDTYGSAEVKLRVYPNERALRGFSIGVSAGMGRVTTEECCTIGGPDVIIRGPDGTIDGAQVRRRTKSGATAGVVLDYNWLLGRSRRFFVGTGIGAKRLFGNLGEDDFFEIRVLPTVRLQVGAAF